MRIKNILDSLSVTHKGVRFARYNGYYEISHIIGVFLNGITIPVRGLRVYDDSRRSDKPNIVLYIGEERKELWIYSNEIERFDYVVGSWEE